MRALWGPEWTRLPARHPFEVLVQERDDCLWVFSLHDRREPGEVCENEAALAPLAAEAKFVRMLEQMVHEVRRDVAGEGVLDPAALAVDGSKREISFADKVLEPDEGDDRDAAEIQDEEQRHDARRKIVVDAVAEHSPGHQEQ
jgi:hypothetical protein